MLRLPCRRAIGLRSFSTTSGLLNAASDKNKDHQKDAKRKLKRAQLIKQKNKQPPELHPLYMEIPTALKYLRAAEVGQPAKKTTISILMTVLPDKGSKPLSGSIYFPKPIKENQIMVFSLDEEVLENAKKLGASIVGGLELIEDIKEGKVKLDNLTQSFATPDIVKDLKSVARNLGPKGLMPTAKRGTVSDDIEGLIRESSGSLLFKQKEQHLSIPIGRCDFSDKEILQNLKAASKAIYGSQPPGTKKPNLIGKTFLSSTIGPSILINFKT